MGLFNNLKQDRLKPFIIINKGYIGEIFIFKPKFKIKLFFVVRRVEKMHNFSSVSQNYVWWEQKLKTGL